jgi:MFS family permease
MAPGETSAAITILAIGIGLGLEFDALGYFCAHYFGRVAMGRIYGTLFTIFSIGGALGSSIAGFSYDRFHSYVPMLLFGTLATFVAVVFTASLGRHSETAYRSDVAGAV